MTGGKPSASSLRHVLVTVDDDHRGHLDAFARELRSAGLCVVDCFPMSGVIAGSVAPTDLEKLRTIEGVAAVEEEPVYRVL